MGYESHLLGYRQYSTDELAAERTTLMAARTTFVSQSMGSKSFQRDLRLLEERLQAVNFVIRSRGSLEPIKPVINYGVGQTDFNGVSR
jgi:hypothetical protein